MTRLTRLCAHTHTRTFGNDGENTKQLLLKFSWTHSLFIAHFARYTRIPPMLRTN